MSQICFLSSFKWYTNVSYQRRKLSTQLKTSLVIWILFVFLSVNNIKQSIPDFLFLFLITKMQFIYLNRWKRFIFVCAAWSRNTSSRSSFTLVSKSKAFRRGLLNHSNVCMLLWTETNNIEIKFTFAWKTFIITADKLTEDHLFLTTYTNVLDKINIFLKNLIFLYLHYWI